MRDRCPGRSSDPTLDTSAGQTVAVLIRVRSESRSEIQSMDPGRVYTDSGSDSAQDAWRFLCSSTASCSRHGASRGSVCDSAGSVLRLEVHEDVVEHDAVSQEGG